MKKNNNIIIIILLGIIIVILLTLSILLATNKLFFNSNNKNSNNLKEPNNNSEIQNNNSQEKSKNNYSDYIGTWINSQTSNEITIKNITDNELTFTWFLYRLAGIDDDTTISFKNGKGIFFYQGHNDKNYDGEITEDEKYIRKGTIELTDSGVNVILENVTEIDTNYTVIDNFNGSVFVKTGTYTHTEKK